MRDWSQEGAPERTQSYGRICQEAQRQLAVRDPDNPPKILVPGMLHRLKHFATAVHSHVQQCCLLVGHSLALEQVCIWLSEGWLLCHVFGCACYDFLCVICMSFAYDQHNTEATLCIYGLHEALSWSCISVCCTLAGAGLGRLCLELTNLGFEVQGNEFSYYMLLTSSFILNHTERAEQWTVFPWMHSNCNQKSIADQLRGVIFLFTPDYSHDMLMLKLL